LAAAAVRSGYKADVIDRYGDCDTRQIAESVRIYCDSADDFCNYPLLLPHIEDLFSNGRKQIVTGSGFESCPDVLEQLQQQFTVIGNSADTVRSLKNPDIFFPLLASLNIPHPETRTDGVPDAGRWLRKSRGGNGGRHICDMEMAAIKPAEGCYYQERLDGRSCSVLFLANGEDAICVGLNEVWNVSAGNRPYTFAGAVTLPLESFRLRDQLEYYIKRLVRQFHLVGLCGLDFIHAQDDIQVLEINPRPTATLALHDVNGSLFAAHISACEGMLHYAESDLARDCRGMEVLYTDQDVSIPAEIKWPEWVADIPVSGRRINAGEPCCSISAAGDSKATVLNLLEERRNYLKRVIFTHSLSC